MTDASVGHGDPCRFFFTSSTTGHPKPAADAAAFRAGWFRTGDLGHLDLKGDLFITGRASDMYIFGRIERLSAGGGGEDPAP
jgi:long-subunit acyl-CoA synthetase (AMP-forming)